MSPEQLAAAYSAEDPLRYFDEIAVGTDRKVASALHDLDTLLRASGDSVSVLDVGCGDGRFLQTLQQRHPSVRALGQELPGPLASLWQAKGVRVYTGALENIVERFSVIVLLDVVEHVPDPNRSFVHCRSLLKERGHVYIHTPRLCFWDGLFLAATRIPGARWLSRAWLRTRISIFHLQLWTDTALTLSLQKAGLELVYLRPQTELSWPLERYLRVYLGERVHLPPLLLRPAAWLAHLLFVWPGTLRNKAICLARLPSGNPQPEPR
ncbi:class I SAM-dependent methyltransferase [Acidobacteriia bacterium AH_259_A11_L15]|nr:class I SAM-dependent methyltransferase [Acidobacteriia bacterium AH_259_A11_L15]